MTNVKSFLASFHIHPLLWLVLAIGVLTGSFTEIIIIFSLVFIHEMGHLLMALFFRWRIKKVMFWPFGGVMETEEYFSRPYKEEFLVVLGGPLQHVWIHFLLQFLLENAVFSPYIIEYAMLYNFHLFFFNLLPIFPLDGGKLVFLLFSYRMPFVKVVNFTILLSVTCIFLGLVVAYMLEWTTFHTLSLACFLLVENRLEWKQRQFVFIRHLMARYYKPSQRVFVLKEITVSGKDTIYEVLKRFYKGYYHKINFQSTNKHIHVINEEQCLKAYFDCKKPYQSVEQVVDIVNT
jgi:stage IV sporulation protein FB